jgi:hypothetical protein
VSECVAQKIYKMHVASQHKFNIPTYRRKWWELVFMWEVLTLFIWFIWK